MMRYTNPLGGINASFDRSMQGMQAMGQGLQSGITPIVAAEMERRKKLAELAELQALDAVLNPQAQPEINPIDPRLTDPLPTPQAPRPAPLGDASALPPMDLPQVPMSAPPSTQAPMPGNLRERLSSQAAPYRNRQELDQEIGTLRGRMAGNAARQKAEAEAMQARIRGQTQGPRPFSFATQDEQGNPIWSLRGADGVEITRLPRDGKTPNLRGFERFDPKTQEEYRVDDSDKEIPGTRQPSSARLQREAAERDRARGRPLSSGQADDFIMLESAAQTLRDIEKAYSGISNMERGPVAGRVARANPYNAQVVAIEKLLDSITPMIARGVFREVGVLTDTDMTRYREMLPALNHDPAAADLVFRQLREKIQGTYSKSIEILGNVGYDVSGLDPDRKLFPKGGDGILPVQQGEFD